MNDGYRMRPAAPEDWAALAALDQEIFGWYGAQEEPEIVRSRLVTFPQGCAVLEGLCDAGDTFIAGYLTSEKWARLREPALDQDPRHSHEPLGRVLNITTLAVVPSCRNRGLGLRLLDHAVAVARQERCTRIVLETAHAEQFYRRRNFRRIGERTQRGITLAIMLLDLAEAEPGAEIRSGCKEKTD